MEELDGVQPKTSPISNPSHLSELKSCKSIISTDFFIFSYVNSARHNSVFELC